MSRRCCQQLSAWAFIILSLWYRSFGLCLGFHCHWLSLHLAAFWHHLRLSVTSLALSLPLLPKSLPLFHYRLIYCCRKGEFQRSIWHVSFMNFNTAEQIPTKYLFSVNIDWKGYLEILYKLLNRYFTDILIHRSSTVDYWEQKPDLTKNVFWLLQTKQTSGCIWFATLLGDLL